VSGGAVRSALYRGEVVHARNDRHARRAFRYPVYTAVIDPTELPMLSARLRLLGHNRPALFALRDRDYEDAADGLAAAHARAIAPLGLAPPRALRVVTNLAVAGYVFNPVSFFLGYRADAPGAAPEHVVAEVNNTYGGRHRYLLGPAHQVASPSTYRVERTFFVSPFLHGQRTYEFDVGAPLDGATLDVRMHVATMAGVRGFSARLRGARLPLTDRNLARLALRFPLMTVQVIGLIHWQALRLRALGVPYRAPGPDHVPHPESSVAA
jgi:DUF1365 family protein